MVKYKNKEQIKLLTEGGKILSKVLAEVIKKVKPGVTTSQLNALAEELIAGYGGVASFKNYKAAWAEHAYPAALCVSVNDEVVHGIPDDNRILKDGDIVGLDIAMHQIILVQIVQSFKNLPDQLQTSLLQQLFFQIIGQAFGFAIFHLVMNPLRTSGMNYVVNARQMRVVKFREIAGQF